jgi:hypothetical protein
MAKGKSAKKQKSAKKLARAGSAKAQTKADDGGNDAAHPKLNRPSLAALASAGAPGAALTPSRSGKQLWALDSVKELAPTATKKRSMFMSAYKSLKRAAGIPSKKDRPAEKGATNSTTTSAARDAAASTQTTVASSNELDGTLPDVAPEKRSEETPNAIPRLDAAKALAGLGDYADDSRSERRTHAAYLDALRRALPSDVRPDRTAKEFPETLETLETAETSDARLPAAPVADASPLSPPRARFAQTVRRLVGDMRRRHEASISTARGMLRSLDALESLEPAAVAFGRVQRRADAAFWSSLPPVAAAAETAPAISERGTRNALGHGFIHGDGKNAPLSSSASPSSMLLSPRTKPPTPRVVEARHEERERALVAEAARESESFAFWAAPPPSRSVSAPASPSGGARAFSDDRGDRVDRVDLNDLNDRDDRDDVVVLTSARKGNKAVFPTEARFFGAARAPAAAAVATAASRVKPPASVARRLAAVDASSMRFDDAGTPDFKRRLPDTSSSSESSESDASGARFRTWVAGHGGSRFSAAETNATSREKAKARVFFSPNEERESRLEEPKPSVAALAAARARDAARTNRMPKESSSSSSAAAALATGTFQSAFSARRDSREEDADIPVASQTVPTRSPPPARRAGDLDRLREMRRRLQAEYEDEARAMRLRSPLRNSRGPGPSPSLASPTKSSARKQQKRVHGVYSESPRSPGGGAASASSERRRTAKDGDAEEEVWHDLARLGGFASFEEVPSSAKPLDVPSARLRAAYAMEAHRRDGGSFGSSPRSGRDRDSASRRDEDGDYHVANEDGDYYVAAPSSSSPRGASAPRAVGSPATAKAGFDALYRRREARRAAKANAVGRPWAPAGGK